MIVKPINLSKESKIKFIIRELRTRGVHKCKEGKSLESLDYFTLLSMLAIRKAVES